MRIRARTVVSAIAASALTGAATAVPLASAPPAGAANAVPTLVWQQVIPNATVKFSSPNVATLGSGGPSVVVGAENGNVYAYHLATGTPVAGWPVQTHHPVDSSPSVAPLAPGGLDDVFIGTGNYSTAYSSGNRGGYLAYGPGGNQLWYQPGPWPGSASGSVQASMAIGTVAANGQPAAVAGDLGQEMYALNAHTGGVLPGWPYLTADSVFSSPALVQLPGSTTPSVVEGSDQSQGAPGSGYVKGGTLRAVTGTGHLLWSFHTNEVIDSSPAVGSLAGNGSQQIVFGTGTYWSLNGGASDTTKLFSVAPNGQLLWSANLNGSTLAAPALADLTGNGQLDAVEGTINGTQSGAVWAFNSQGQVLPGFPVTPAPGRFVDSQVATADLYNQGRQDILIPSALGLFAYNGQGQQLFNIAANHIVLQNTPLVTQDPNGTLGITIAGVDVQNSADSIVAHYELPGGKIGARAWPQFRHDPRLTGNMSPPALATVPHVCSQTFAPGTVVGLAPDATGKGYWITNRYGQISTCGDAPFMGSTGALHISNVVGIASTPGGGGYYLTTSNGAVYGFGNASWKGSAAHVVLAAPVVGIATTPNGGYLQVTSRGNVYNFGTPWYGSTATLRLPSPVTSIAAEGNGGYLLTTAGGNVFNFGTPWHGSIPASHISISAPIKSIAANPATGGYWLASANGGIFSFDAPFYGSAGADALSASVANMSTVPGGYRLATQSGAVYDFGTAGYFGNAG